MSADSASTVNRLKQQTLQYLRQYQEQKRLSPEQIQTLSDATIQTQASYIQQLETEIAGLQGKIRSLEIHLKSSSKVAVLCARAVQQIAKWRGGTVWVSNATDAATNQEEEPTRPAESAGGDYCGLEIRAQQGRK